MESHVHILLQEADKRAELYIKASLHYMMSFYQNEVRASSWVLIFIPKFSYRGDVPNPMIPSSFFNISYFKRTPCFTMPSILLLAAFVTFPDIPPHCLTLPFLILPQIGAELGQRRPDKISTNYQETHNMLKRGALALLHPHHRNSNVLNAVGYVYRGGAARQKCDTSGL